LPDIIATLSSSDICAISVSTCAAMSVCGVPEATGARSLVVEPVILNPLESLIQGL
jgi:hypothetical protein